MRAEARRMYIGVDIGTSLTKAVAFDADAREAGTEAVSPRLPHPAAGRVEQDADEVFASVGSVVGRLTARLSGPVRLLALTGQGDGLWLLDGQGRPTRPALSWM